MRVSAEFFVGENAPPRASRARGFFMENIITETFDNWTDYNVWLTQHYDTHSVIKLNESGGKVIAEYVTADEWEKEQKRAGLL